MDPVKVAIFLVVFGLLLVIGRVLSRLGETRIDSSLPVEPEPTPPPTPSTPLSDAQGNRSPAVTGAEFGMPISLPSVQRTESGSFNRPIFTNYHFSRIDLAQGPADPSSFCDDLTLEMENPATGMRWTIKYTVATPAGLNQLMSKERFESLYFDTAVVIVSRWDLRLILQTVIEEIMRDQGQSEFQASED